MRNLLLAGVLMISTAADASVLGGRVVNQTTGKVAVGDQVILLDLSIGKIEVARTRTDAAGYFYFRVLQLGVPRSVRVIHGGVAYDSNLREQVQPEINVYDVDQTTAGIKSEIQAIRIEASGEDLQVTEMFSLANNSSPARVVQKKDLFVLSLPAGATIISSQAQEDGGAVINPVAVASGDGERCSFSFPLKPGVTKIQVQYRVGSTQPVVLSPEVPFAADMFGIMVPPSMQFESVIPGRYEKQPNESGGTVELIRHAAAGQAPGFRISAIKMTAVGGVAQPLATNVSGGSITHTTGWMILLPIVTVACMMGFVYYRWRRGAAPSEAPSGESMREQLFALELKRVQNQISKTQYDAARSSLRKGLASVLSLHEEEPLQPVIHISEKSTSGRG